MLVVARVTHEIPVERSLEIISNDNYIYIFFFSIRGGSVMIDILDSQFVSTIDGFAVI